MEMTPENGRTHEPSLRELTAELDGVKQLLLSKLDALREIINERHERYKERFEAQESANATALAANKELTAASFASSEKAIKVATDSQNAFNEKNNEIRGALTDQGTRMVTRPEVDTRFDGIADKLEDHKQATENKFVSMKQELEKRNDEVRVEISNLRESRSSTGGFKEAETARQAQRNFMIGILVVAVIGLCGLIVSVIQLVKHP